MSFRVVAPATVANLGPGFDCLALTLDLSNEFEVDPEGLPEVAVEGEGAGELPADASNLVVRAAVHLARAVGERAPSFALRCRNRIPLERGLGSSASAVVAGLLIAERLLNSPVGPDALLSAAAEMEGHPDNVGACLRGGVAVAYREEGGGWRVETLPASPDVRPVVLVPDGERVSTEEARAVLPPVVPLRDAVFNVSRAVLATVALTSRPALLAPALDDRLHQPHRLPLMPRAAALFTDLRAAGIPVCVCGSGPSLLAFEDDERRVPDPGPGWRVLRPGVSAEGARVEEVGGSGGADAPEF